MQAQPMPEALLRLLSQRKALRFGVQM